MGVKFLHGHPRMILFTEGLFFFVNVCYSQVTCRQQFLSFIKFCVCNFFAGFVVNMLCPQRSEPIVFCCCIFKNCSQIFVNFGI